MIKSRNVSAIALLGALSLSGCGELLDVNNPNNLVEESVQLPAAAEGVVNGALRAVSVAASDVWEGPAVVSDELYWTGSRDAWGQLDQGFIGDPLNEFTDGAFPSLGQATWMANYAVGIVEGHVSSGDAPASLLARAKLYRGIINLVVGESQEDYVFSDKQESGTPLGPGNMRGVIESAISDFSDAMANGDADVALAAQAMRARAYMSAAIWDDINPSATGCSLDTGAGCALDFGAAVADADAVVGAVGVGSDWMFKVNFSSASTGSPQHGNVNQRGENQWDESLVANSGPGATARGDVTLLDPYSGDPDPAVGKAESQYGDDSFSSLTMTSERLMHLILAEDALNAGDVAGFETHINHIRVDIDGMSAYAGGASPVAGVADVVVALSHTRRANTLMQGLRLQDMYRWGLTDPKWQAASQAVTSPGMMLPITVVECRANENVPDCG
ncbi:MAG: hypothetical protein ACPHO4_09145 [Longimicrobiales bacterium]